jgi:hypothetical protein
MRLGIHRDFFAIRLDDTGAVAVARPIAPPAGLA